MRQLIPMVPKLIFDRFNWFEERTNAIAENVTHIRSVKIWTVNDCNKALATFFGGKFVNLEDLHVPINTL